MRSYFTDNGHLLDEILLLLFAGHETSSHTLTTAIYRFLKHPECREKIRAELGALTNGKELEQLTLSEINTLDYLHNFIKECLRLDTAIPANTPNITKTTMEIDGVVLPTGLPVNISLLGFHHNPDEWVQPSEFRPDRFEQDSPLFLNAQGKPRHPLSFMGFSSGIRNCLGQTLALAEMKAILVTLISELKLEAEDPSILEKEEFFMFSSPTKLPLKAH